MKLIHCANQFIALIHILNNQTPHGMNRAFMFEFPPADKIAEAVDGFGPPTKDYKPDPVIAGFLSDLVMGSDRIGAVYVIQEDKITGMILVRTDVFGPGHDALAVMYDDK